MADEAPPRGPGEAEAPEADEEIDFVVPENTCGACEQLFGNQDEDSNSMHAPRFQLNIVRPNLKLEKV